MVGLYLEHCPVGFSCALVLAAVVLLFGQVTVNECLYLFDRFAVRNHKLNDLGELRISKATLPVDGLAAQSAG